MRSFVRVAVCLVVTASLAACSGKSDSAASSGATPGEVAAGATAAPSGAGTVIGVSIQNREAQFYQDMEAGLKSGADRYGYVLQVVDAARDNAKQQSQVEDFVSRKVGAIVLTPYDSQAIGSAIAEANDANIPVFTADIANASDRGRVVAHVASDNVEGGGQAAKLVCQAIGTKKATVAILDEPEVTSIVDRVRGFKETLAKECPNAVVISDIDGGGERAKSSAATEDILQAHPDLDAIFGTNDDSALGAVKAVQAAGKKVAIVGYDATPEARSAIKDGSMYGDAIQHPFQIGSQTIEAIHDALNGKTPAAKIVVPVGTFTKANASP